MHRIGRSAGGEKEGYLLDLTKPYYNLLGFQKGNQKQNFYWDFNVAAMDDVNKTARYYLQDELGSPLRVLCRNGNGGMYGYDEFGGDLYDPEKEQSAGKQYSRQGAGRSFGYAGYRCDDISGTYFAQAREYQSQIGRFLAEDIIRGKSTRPKTLNRYCVLLEGVNMGIEMNLITIALLLIDLIFVFLLRINLYKQYIKKENGRMQLAEIKQWKEIYFIYPTYYEVKIEYVDNGRKKRSTIRTSSLFLKKYRNKKYIQIVTIPGTDFVFLEEEKWVRQNIEWKIMIVATSLFLLPLLLIIYLEIFIIRKACYILFVIFLLLYFFFQLRYKTDFSTPNKHKTRMKYITKMTCEEVIEKLGQGTDSNFILEKEDDNIKNKLYLFSMKNKVLFHWGCKCNQAQYKLFVTPAQEGSAVLLYLCCCSNRYALNQYAKKVKCFMKKRIGAVRVE